MDLLKTLLVYMTVLLSSSVQQSALPTPSAVQQMTPVPVVTATATPYIPPATASPVTAPPFSSTTAPLQPQATQFVMLAAGSRGEEVKKLQRRLIELKYLSSGSADGVFGNNTKKAVERFQHYNGLKVDGVVGKNTARKLYHDPKVVVAPVDVKPTRTPKPNALVVQLPVLCKDTRGNLLATYVLPLQVGRTTVYADDARVGSGYRLKSSRSVQVTVGRDGRMNPSSVVFTYEKNSNPSVTVNVPVYYKLTDGTRLSTDFVQCASGVLNTIYADASRVPSGYQLTGANRYHISVDANGVATPSSITFFFIRPEQEIQVNLPVYYQNEKGDLLFGDVVPLKKGTHTVAADDAYVPLGYVLVGPRSQLVTVDERGNASPKSLIFVYKAPKETAAAKVKIHYVDEKANSLYTQDLLCLEGETSVTANDNLVPAGYVLTGERVQKVVVGSDGKATPDTVTFVYRAPVKATLTILYQDKAGNRLHEETRTLSEGKTTVSADDGKVPGGYTLQSERNVEVTVSSEGAVVPNSVTFVYQQPINASVRVVYVDEASNVLYEESAKLNLGANTIVCDPSKAGKGYTLTGETSRVVTVSEDGTQSDTTVTFTFKAPITVNLPVRYTDENGNELHMGTVPVRTGENTVKADLSLVPNGYRLSGNASVSVVVDVDGNATPAEVAFVFRAPTPIDKIYKLPIHVSARLEGGHDVYQGPGTQYFKFGKAFMGGGQVRLYGLEGDWMLIGYGTSDGNFRIGYIPASAKPADVDLPALSLSHYETTVNSSASLTADPIISVQNGMMAKLPEGAPVIVLAFMQETDRWAFVETTLNGKTVRGFVARQKLN